MSNKSTPVLVLALAMGFWALLTTGPVSAFQHQFDDKELERFLNSEEQDERSLREPGQYMERCGNRFGCAEGLQCTQMAIGKRCFPQDCFEQELAAISFNEADYSDTILEDAGLTEEELLKIKEDAKDDEGVAFLRSSAFSSILKALQNNPEPIQKVQNIQRKCMSQALANTPRNSTENQVEYIGLTFEIAALAEFTWSALTVDLFDIDSSPFNDTKTYCRLCFGGGPKGMAQFGYITGTMFDTTNPDDLACCSIWANADVNAGYGVGCAAGSGFNGKRMCENTIGFGAGIGAGISTCTTWKGPIG